MWAFCLVLFVGNFWLKRLLNILEAIAAICHVVFFLVSIITLLAMAQRSTASFVFKTLIHNAPGWTNPGAAWGIGLLTVTYSLAGRTSLVKYDRKC
jgi:peptidoglycan/LPS O-acetylase OafA/YrhL